MPLSKVKVNCPHCGKPWETQETFTFGDINVFAGKCGHSIQQEQLAHSDAEVISLDGKKPFPYQNDTVSFMERATFPALNGRLAGNRALIAHEMGLGKTVCVLSFLARHLDQLPFLAIVKSSLKVQWQHETMRWLGEEYFAQIIEESTTPLFKDVAGYIISYDLLRRMRGFIDLLKKRGVKTVVMDECQQIKNRESQRTAFAMEICNNFPNVFALSGTPIKNNASEYFPVLHVINPQRFPTYNKFVQYDCDFYRTGYAVKVGGLRSPEKFHEQTKDFIIRRTRAEVKEEIGMQYDKAVRRFSFHELSKEVEAAYKLALKAFQDRMANGSDTPFMDDNALAYISRMRHLAGLSLLEPVVDHVEEFLESTDRKIAIFIHHQDVAELLERKLGKICAGLGLCPPLNLTSSLNSEQRAELVRKFNSSEYRVGIFSTLAAGEGLNLQTCSDAIMMERQWNPANEEQAEARFIRIGQKNQVEVTYFIAIGTVVEFFTEIVEKKRATMAQVLDGKEYNWDETSIMKELVEVLDQIGGKKWGF